MKYNSKTIKGRIEIYEDLLEGYLTAPDDDASFINGMCAAMRDYLRIGEVEAYTMPEIYKRGKLGKNYYAVDFPRGQRDVRIEWLEKTIEELKSKL